MNNMQVHHYQERSQNQNNQYRGDADDSCASAISSSSNNMHSNIAFTEFQGGESSIDSGGTTRIVFGNGNGDRLLRCGGGIKNGRYCEGIPVETTGNFQFHNHNYGRGKPFRHHQANSFRGESFGQRNYVQPQGQERFVKIQGCKMRHNNNGYRNFMQQHKPKQFRGRYNQYSNNNNHYKQQRNNFELNPDSIQIQKEVQDFLAQQRELQQQHQNATMGNRSNFGDAGRFSPGNSSGSGSSSKSVKQTVSLNARVWNDDDNSNRPGRSHQGKESRSNKASRNKRKNDYSQSPPESKTPSPNGRTHNLSYEDITENSEGEDKEDAIAEDDLRQRLLWKKHCEQVVKREPGEIYSDEEDESPEYQQQPNKKVKLETSSKDYETSAKRSSTTSEISGNRLESSSSKGKPGKETKKEDKKVVVDKPSPTATVTAAAASDDSKKKNQSQSRPYKIPHSYDHDNRFQGKQASKVSTRSPEIERRKECSSSPNDSSDSCKNVCEGESKEKIGNLQRTLRETRDKLLETRVVASKKALRLKQEIDKLNARLDDSAKKESDLKAALKSVENELSTKRLELAKMTTLHDVELREKEKFRADLTRTYQDRLTIEIEKLRALFDIELAKMQAFYLAQNLCFEDGTGVNFLKETSECEDRNQEKLSSKINNGDVLQQAKTSRSESGLSSVGLAAGTSGVSFMQSSYFDYPAMAPGHAQFSPINSYQNGLFKCPVNSVSNYNQSHCSRSPTSSSSATSADSGIGGSLLNIAFGHRVRSSASPSPTSIK